MKLVLFVALFGGMALGQTDPPFVADPVTHSVPVVFLTGGCINGHGWSQWSREQKVFYVEGLEDGLLFAAEAGGTITVPNLTNGETVGRIDRIYSQLKYLNISAAGVVAMLFWQQKEEWSTEKAKSVFDHAAELSDGEHTSSHKQ